MHGDFFLYLNIDICYINLKYTHILWKRTIALVITTQTI